MSENQRQCRDVALKFAKEEILPVAAQYDRTGVVSIHEPFICGSVSGDRPVASGFHFSCFFKRQKCIMVPLLTFVTFLI